jgi:hypothetical protein
MTGNLLNIISIFQYCSQSSLQYRIPIPKSIVLHNAILKIPIPLFFCNTLSIDHNIKYYILVNWSIQIPWQKL